MSNELINTPKLNDFRSLINRSDVKQALNEAAAKNFSVDRLLRIMVTVVRGNEKLLDCTPKSLLAGIMSFSVLGLDPEPILGQGYLVPFWNNKKGCLEATFIPGYRGYITLARRSGEIASIAAEVVKDGDLFDYELGSSPFIKHKYAERDRGETIGAWALWKLNSGEIIPRYMPLDEINKHRERSMAKNSGPWVTDFDAMARKTPIRDSIKFVPLSVELATMTALDTCADVGRAQSSYLLPSLQEDGEDDFMGSGDDDNVIDVRGGESPVSVFDRQADTYMKKNKVAPELWNYFVEGSAKSAKLKVDQLKTEAAGRFDEFTQQFEVFARKRKGGPSTSKAAKKPEKEPESNPESGGGLSEEDKTLMLKMYGNPDLKEFDTFLMEEEGATPESLESVYANLYGMDNAETAAHVKRFKAWQATRADA